MNGRARLQTTQLPLMGHRGPLDVRSGIEQLNRALAARKQQQQAQAARIPPPLTYKDKLNAIKNSTAPSWKKKLDFKQLKIDAKQQRDDKKLLDQQQYQMNHPGGSNRERALKKIRNERKAQLKKEKLGSIPSSNLFESIVATGPPDPSEMFLT